MLIAISAQSISARSLILDLVDTSEPAAFSVGELVRAGAALGIEPTGIRTALTRLKADGSILSVERGRYKIGGRGAALQHRILGWRMVLERRREWQGEWLLAVTGPQDRADRTVWRRTVRALELEGFAEAEANVWARPDNLTGGVEGMRQRLAALEAASSLLLVQANGLDPVRAARFPALWQGDALCDSHTRLADALDHSAIRIATAALPASAAETLLLGRQAIRAIMRDPLLPDAFCPTDGLSALISAMTRYDRIGKRVWHDYLAA